MATPEFLVVGLVRKAHGVRGEVLVEALTDTPDAIFAPGNRVLAGTADADIAPSRQALRIRAVRPLGAGLLVRFEELQERNAAEAWRGRYLLLPSHELTPPGPDEVYRHELIGMRVELAGGLPVGTVEELYELPQGLALEVRRTGSRSGQTVIILYDVTMIASVDKGERVIVVTPPEGLLE